ncbi:hypothetical protein [Polymorphospora rubra]|uniref:Uncharacterized protein n=1 Tax=Polymorphospora rubra TaxID=338584 RepID=A0A810NCV0_9ACTN|nr:hypothetical protein [Polymorphospora rubra]BCJ70154.1 hypothetical protein Prubr_71750 [Polymorphospora rubra]
MEDDRAPRVDDLDVAAPVGAYLEAVAAYGEPQVGQFGARAACGVRTTSTSEKPVTEAVSRRSTPGSTSG